MDETVATLVARNEMLVERVRQLEAMLMANWRPPIEWGLTNSEARVVATLAGREMATKDQLMAALYSDRPEEPDGKIVDVLVCRIRRKLQPFGVVIETVWGQGYVLKDREKWKGENLI